MKVYVLVALATTVTLTHLHADLDEHRFTRYSNGDVLEQNDWQTEGIAQEGAGYSILQDRGEIRSSPDKSGKLLVWLQGFAGFEQSRFVKKFPATSDQKCQVEIEIKPGDSEAGKIFLDQQNVGGLVLRFVRGGIELMDARGDSSEAVLSTVKWDDWLKIKLNVDFEKHTVEIFVDGDSAGTFPISESLTAFDQINIFGGGAAFETQVKDIKITSVNRFK